MQSPPWPDAIWFGSELDTIFRLCTGVYVLLSYFDEETVVVDTVMGSIYYIDFDRNLLPMRTAEQRMLQSVVGYTAHDHTLDGVKLSAYCYIDNEMIAFTATQDDDWIVFRPRQK